MGIYGSVYTMYGSANMDMRVLSVPWLKAILLFASSAVNIVINLIRRSLALHRLKKRCTVVL